jgi:hypothetical protein
MRRGWIALTAIVVLVALAFGCGPRGALPGDQTVTLRGEPMAVYPGARIYSPVSSTPTPDARGSADSVSYVTSDSMEKVGRFYLRRYGRGARIQGDSKLLSVQGRRNGKTFRIALSRTDSETAIQLTVVTTSEP